MTDYPYLPWLVMYKIDLTNQSKFVFWTTCLNLRQKTGKVQYKHVQIRINNQYITGYSIVIGNHTTFNSEIGTRF